MRQVSSSPFIAGKEKAALLCKKSVMRSNRFNMRDLFDCVPLLNPLEDSVHYVSNTMVVTFM
jgi:hypothetical protein